MKQMLDRFLAQLFYNDLGPDKQYEKMPVQY